MLNFQPFLNDCHQQIYTYGNPNLATNSIEACAIKCFNTQMFFYHIKNNSIFQRSLYNCLIIKALYLKLLVRNT